MNTCIHQRRRREIRRREYLSLFTTKTTVDPYSGKDQRAAVYIGPWYVLPVQGQGKRRVCVQLLALWAVALIAFLLCGFSNARGSRVFYVLPFYLLLPFPLFYWILGVFRFWRSPVRLTEVDKDEGYDRLRVSTLGAVALCGLHTAGEAVLLALGGAGEALSLEVLYTLGIVLAGLCAWASRRILRPLEPLAEAEESPPQTGGSAAGSAQAPANPAG